MYFFGWPYLSAKIWPAFIGPMEKPEDFTALTAVFMLLKGACYCAMAFISLLLYIYFKQESLLYVPAQPYQYIE
jgi:hypothetical protein